MSDVWSHLESMVSQYVHDVRAELEDRWQKWPIDLTTPELHEVVGGLLARQVTLATQLAMSPGIWNGHVAPIILRCMTDVYITLAWILKDPVERSRKFVLFGLGQQKLILEHRKAALQEDGKNPEEDSMVKFTTAWLNQQRFDFLTNVSVGSWSEVPVRDMAAEAGCLDLYRYAYTPFSAATHSMWHHISRVNLRSCENPLHRYHRVPVDPDMAIDPDYLYRAARYAAKTFRLFDKTFEIKSGAPSAVAQLEVEFEKLGSGKASDTPKSGEVSEQQEDGE